MSTRVAAACALPFLMLATARAQKPDATGASASVMISPPIQTGSDRADPASTDSGLSDSASTQPEPPKLDQALDARKTSWTVQLEPLMWYVSPSGDLRLPARSGTGGPTGGGFPDSGDEVELSRLNLDSPEFSPAGEAHFSADRLRITFSGATFYTDGDQFAADAAFRIGAVQVTPGQALSVDFEFSTFELTAGYNIWSRDFTQATDTTRRAEATQLLLRTYLFGGGRLYEADVQVSNLTTGTRADADHTFIEPIIGARAELEITRQFTIDLQISGGYFADSDQSSVSFDIAAGFMYHPHPNIGIQIGYRQLAYQLSDGDGLSEFEYNGRLAGLYAGIVLRF